MRSVTVTAFVVVATFVSELVVVCCVLCVVYSAVTCVLHDSGDLRLNRLIQRLEDTLESPISCCEFVAVTILR